MNEQHNRKTNKEDNCCCSADQAPAKQANHNEHDHDHNTTTNEAPAWKSHWQLLLSLFMLAIMLALEFGLNYKPPFPIDLIIYGAAYLLAGYNVLLIAFRKAKRFDFFNEFFLMSVATIGAFAIGSYSEGVAVMIFYSIGEWFQDSAVSKAKRSIKALLDIRPDKVTVIRNGKTEVANPNEVKLDDIIQVKPGEKVALDGDLLSNTATFNTAALTGEVEEKWKVGLEAYYFSKQRLTDNTYGKEYWICGFMVEKLWEKFSLFINFENFTDTRQTRFDSIYTGTITNPVFRDIYAPVDGFVVNGGLKLNL